MAAAAVDDAVLKTRIMTALQADARTAASLAESCGLDVHAMGFALRRLAKAGVIEPTWLGDEKAWRLSKPKAARHKSIAMVNNSEAVDRDDDVVIGDPGPPEGDELADGANGEEVGQPE